MLAVKLFEQSAQANDKFLAALTLAIKLNHSSVDLDEHTVQFILRVTLRWFVEAVHQSLPAFVLQRISSTLAIVSTVPVAPSYRCVPSILTQLAFSGTETSFDQPNANIEDLVESCTDADLAALLNFLIAFAEDIRSRIYDLHNYKAYQMAASNTSDVTSLLSKLYRGLLSKGGPGEAKPIYSASVPKCHLQWIKFNRSTSVSNEEEQFLLGLLPNSINLLLILSDQDRTFETATALLEGVFKDERLVLPEELRVSFEVLLRHPKALDFLDIDSGFVEDGNVHFNRMVLAFCKRQTQLLFLPHNAQIDALLNDPTKKVELKNLDTRRSFVMNLVRRITSCLSHRVLEEGLVTATIEFWEEFVQDTRDHHLHFEAMNFVLEAIPGFCSAAVLRELNEKENSYDMYGEAENELREELRMRLRDLLQVCCEEYGLPAFNRLIDTAEDFWYRAERNDDFEEVYAGLDATLYFIVELAESLRFSSSEDELQPGEDAALARLFGSVWFSTILRKTDPTLLPLQQLALRTIGEFNLYFGSHEQELWQALDLLISKMADARLASAAAIALRDLCDQNRAQVASAGQVGQMTEVCAQYFSYAGAQREPKSAIAAAVANIAQALPTSKETAESIDQLLAIVYDDYQRRITIASDDMPLRVVAARDCLNLLATIGRASQGLDDDDLAVLNPTEYARADNERRQYWHSEMGRSLQLKMLYQVQKALQDGDFEASLILKACDIFKTGFRERLVGPFVFNPLVILDFLHSVNQNEGNVGSLMRLVSEFASSLSTSGELVMANGSKKDVLKSLAEYILNVMKNLGLPGNEPELAALCVGALERVLQCQPDTILMVPQDEQHFIVQFSFDSISSPELHLKRAGLNFWNALFQKMSTLTTIDQENLNRMILRVGPLLMGVLMDNIAGKASRTDLDRLADPFRTLVARYPEARLWLEQSLNENRLSKDRVGPQEKKRFFDKVMLLRGSAKTKACIKDFWIQCRGTPSEYR